MVGGGEWGRGMGEGRRLGMQLARGAIGCDMGSSWSIRNLVQVIVVVAAAIVAAADAMLAGAADNDICFGYSFYSG